MGHVTLYSRRGRQDKMPSPGRLRIASSSQHGCLYESERPAWSQWPRADTRHVGRDCFTNAKYMIDGTVELTQNTYIEGTVALAQNTHT